MSVPSASGGSFPIPPQQIRHTEEENKLLAEVERLTKRLDSTPLPGASSIPDLEEIPMEDDSLGGGAVEEEGALAHIEGMEGYKAQNYHLVSWAERGKEMVPAAGGSGLENLMKRFLSTIDFSARKFYKIPEDKHLTFHFYSQSLSYFDDQGVEHTVDLHKLEQYHQAQAAVGGQNPEVLYSKNMSVVLSAYFSICKKAYPNKGDLPVATNGGKGAPSENNAVGSVVQPFHISTGSQSPFASGGACFLGANIFSSKGLTQKEAEIIRDLLKFLPEEKRAEALKSVFSYFRIMKFLQEEKENLQKQIQELSASTQDPQGSQSPSREDKVAILRRLNTTKSFLEQFLSPETNQLPMIIDVMVGGHKETTAEVENAKDAFKLGALLYKKRVGHAPTAEDKEFMVDIGAVATQTSSGYELYMRYEQGKERKALAPIESIESFVRRITLREEALSLAQQAEEEGEGETSSVVPLLAVTPGLFSLWEGFNTQEYTDRANFWEEKIAEMLVVHAEAEQQAVNAVLDCPFFSEEIQEKQTAQKNAPDHAGEAATLLKDCLAGYLAATLIVIDDEDDDEEPEIETTHF